MSFEAPKNGEQNQPSTPPVDETMSNTCQTAEFIYGGPHKTAENASLLDITTPINVQLRGTFRKSFAFYTLTERIPVILTKIIDSLSRNGSTICSAHGASSSDIRSFIHHLTKLKNDLVTNKDYDLLAVHTAEAKRWNRWIENSESKKYFNNVWLFTECYVYRKIYEGVQLTNGLKNLDYFAEQKHNALRDSVKAMCMVAETLVAMLKPSEEEKLKADFVTLLKISLWSNKCDLSLSLGSSEGQVPDPFQMIKDLKDKILVDDSAKIADYVFAKAAASAKVIKENDPEKSQEGEAKEKVRPTDPTAVVFDIVLDNAGYELFSDLCIAHFLVSQGVVQKVRFHVKKMPWFVSDVTQQDFEYVIKSCMEGSFSKAADGDTPLAEGDKDAVTLPPREITSSTLKEIGAVWYNYLQNGTFVIMNDDFWTSPHVYKDMKKIQYDLYRSLQNAVAVMFKGDLNYRKLLGEKNWNPTVGFEESLQGFAPAPIIALRTVKADLISGLPQGKFEEITNVDAKWMEKGDYGLIQFCPNAESLIESDIPKDVGERSY